MGEERTSNHTLTVGAASVEVSPDLRGNAIRTAIVITNVSTAGQVIKLSWGQEAVAGQGIVLYPTASWSETLDNRFTPNLLQLFAIADAAGGTLAIHERVI